ncbi:hypothetical protein CHH28_06450 [Bacterioplanes sanyensis]|uniref:Tail specific protease domain-containing protein n=1 Tax=Bacterioplanes sanyensis TaxID=1249553 RepID=A0A222FI62_9GAMM|nr:S41 family peptidase [Bacterioplanes sanyensis]ASP38342.1 hypothetical protein CHH28_06450 [Bacterioplanes sanyensis]
MNHLLSNSTNAFTNISPMPTLLLTAMLLSLAACGGDSSGKKDKPAVQPDTQPDAQPDTRAPFDGIWVSDAYGEAFSIQGNQLQRYEFTTDHCIQAEVGSVDQQQLTSDGYAIDRGTHTYLRQTIDKHGVQMYSHKYERRNQLPAACLNGVISADQLGTIENPEQEFAYIVQTFDELYPMFDVRQVNWAEHAQQIEQHIVNGMPGEQYIQQLLALIEPLADAHVALVADGQGMGFNRPGLFQDLQQEYIDIHGAPQSQEQVQALLQYIEQQSDLLLQLRLKQASGDQPLDAEADILWYTTADNYGVLMIDAMESEQDDHLADIHAVAALMPQVIDALKDTQGLVIDVRFNGGGSDGVSQVIARHFLDSERNLYQKRVGTGTTAIHDTIRLTPAAHTYLKPVVVLTSSDTTSAAEIFVLMLRNLPHVTVAGQPTQGALSDVLGRVLPSGLQITLGNEQYLDMDDRWFEGTGIAVDHPITLWPSQDREQGKDHALLQALAILKGDAELATDR